MRSPIDAGSIICNKTVLAFMKTGLFDSIAITMENDIDSIAMMEADEKESEEHLRAYC